MSVLKMCTVGFDTYVGLINTSDSDFVIVTSRESTGRTIVNRVRLYSWREP